MMQLDSLTSGLRDMAVTTQVENMEVEQSQLHQQLLAQQQIPLVQQQQQKNSNTKTNYQSHQKCILWD